MSAVIARTAEVIAAEIRYIKADAGKYMLKSVIEIGKRLTEAKELVGHGNWEQWLIDNVEYSQSTANNVMRIFSEYGDAQINLLTGDAPAEVFSSLSYSQAVALFALPMDKRREFVEENDIEGMSTRDIAAAIKAKKEAEDRLADTADELSTVHRRLAELTEEHEAEIEQIAVLEKELDDAKKKRSEAAEKLRNAEKKAAEDAKKKVEAAETALKEAHEKELLELREKAELTDAERERLINEAGFEHRAELARLKAEYEAVEKKLKMQADVNVQRFTVHFENFQRDYAEMKRLAGDMEAGTRDKLLGALDKVLGGMRGDARK